MNTLQPILCLFLLLVLVFSMSQVFDNNLFIINNYDIVRDDIGNIDRTNGNAINNLLSITGNIQNTFNSSNDIPLFFTPSFFFPINN